MQYAFRVSIASLGCLLGALVCGCSGTGAPARPGRLPTLQTVANDHLTALLHCKRWFSILYPAPNPNPCPTCNERLPRQRGDPPKSKRMHLCLSDCTEIDVFQLEDKSGSQVVHFPDGREKTVTWGVARREGSWVKQDMTEALWGGDTLAYEIGINTTGAPYDQYEQGTATLADGRTMQFRHDRNVNRDALGLQPDDGSSLQFTVPLKDVGGKPFNAVYEQGATGTFTSATGQTQTFAVKGTDANRWQEWTMTAAAGITGRFAVNADLIGAGLLYQNGKIAAHLTWTVNREGDLEGNLRPLGATEMGATPSAAARDFQIDAWIHNIAGIGPMPMY